MDRGRRTRSCASGSRRPRPSSRAAAGSRRRCPGTSLGAVFRREVADVHRDLFATERDRYGKDVGHKVELALEVTDAEYERGLRAREEFRERMAAACEGVDLLLTPTLAFVAPPAEREDLDIRDDVIRFTFPVNALGWPALALPCGAAEHGLPASLQLVSPNGDDALVLAAGRGRCEARASS